MKKTVLALAVLLAACASKTGVVPIGDGIYMLGMQDYSLNYHGAKVKAQLYGRPRSSAPSRASACSRWATAPPTRPCTATTPRPK
jgi:hypothetical protein